MNIKNRLGFVITVLIAVMLAGCSGNPVGEKDAVVKPTQVKSVQKKKTANLKVAKANLASKNAKNKVAKKTVHAKSKKPALTRAEVRAKKQSIAALGKSKQVQERLKYARAQARKKYIQNQKRKANNVVKRNTLNRIIKRNPVRVASLARTDWLGRERFIGSQADQPVRKRRTVARVTKPIIVARLKQPVKAKAKRARLPKKVARSGKAIRSQTKQPARSRTQQVTHTKVQQIARNRSQQQARVKAQQLARNRVQQQARKRIQLARSQAKQQALRAKQPVRIQVKQPVRTQATRLARARIASANRQSNLRRVANTRRVVNRQRQAPRVRNALYRKPAKQKIARITQNNSFGYALSGAAIERTKQRVKYDGKYVKIAYPWGDVPKSIGVCTDVVIRAYRRLGIDLQQEVHKDISQDFYAYPNLVKWGLNKPDPNIDHRRVYNLQAFFKRHKADLPRSRNPRDYKPGDLVTWMVGPNFPHIGVVVNKPSKADPKRLMIAHNIGYGPQVEDILFRFPMTGHYRYTPQHRNVKPALLYAKTPPPASVLRRQRNKGLSYAEVLQASKILSGKVNARTLPSVSDLLANKKKTNGKIMLAHLDTSIFDSAGLNREALSALLK